MVVRMMGDQKEYMNDNGMNKWVDEVEEGEDEDEDEGAQEEINKFSC